MAATLFGTVGKNLAIARCLRMPRAQFPYFECQAAMFCCYAEAEDLLALRVVSSAWRHSADEDNVWIQLCAHDLLNTRLVFPIVVQYVTDHRLFYWQARYLEEDVTR